MAKTMSSKDVTTTGDGPTKGHNLSETHKLIPTAFEAMWAKRQAIEKAMETHVNHLKDDLGRLKKNLKTDSGQDLKYLMPSYALYELEQRAKQLEDDDERHNALDGLRIGFEGLQKGEIVDFITALEDDTAPEPAEEPE